MYIVKNRAGQELPVDVITNGTSRRVFLKSGSSTTSEGLTNTMKRLKEMRLLRISTKREKKEDLHTEIREEIINIPITTHGVKGGFDSSKGKISVREIDIEEFLGQLTSEELIDLAKILSITTHGATRQDSLIGKLLVERDKVKDYLLNTAEVNE